MSLHITESASEPMKLLSAASAAEMLGVSRNTVYGLIQTGALRCVAVGRRRLVSRDALADFIAEHSS